jgi:23S rRNA (uracil1939-C5)-methyltransferase
LARKKKTVSDLLITGIADKGKAVGRTENGEVIFVEHAVPGDVVDALVLRKKKSLSEAIVTHFKKYSDDRVEAPCTHFGICGGCKWQNLSYQAQLNHKHQTVKDCMRRIAKLDESVVKPIIGCESDFFYRNKLEYSFSTKRWITHSEASSDVVIEQLGALGFHKAGFFDKIVDIKQCLLQDGLTNDIRNFVREMAELHQYSYYDIRAHQGFLRNMIVRNTLDGQWMVIVVFGQQLDDQIAFLLNQIKSRFPQISSINYVINTKVNDTIFDQEVINFYGLPYIVETLGNIKYRIGPKSFFQTNPRQAIHLFDVAVEYAELKADDVVYDLYTGLGSIALYIAHLVNHVTGIEEIPEAIADAAINKDFNGISNATFYTGDVRDLLNDHFVRKHGKADVIITDPPRAGMHVDVINTLLALAVPRLVYISCNPATQARDLALLSERYDIISVQPVDMFPHTHHIESVAKLRLKQ